MDIILSFVTLSCLIGALIAHFFAWDFRYEHHKAMIFGDIATGFWIFFVCLLLLLLGIYGQESYANY